MILIEIDEDSGVTHYEILEISREHLAGLNDKKITETVSDAAKKAKRQYNLAAQRGDKDAEAVMDKINQALLVLKNPEERKKYDSELNVGKGVSLAVLRIQPASAAFFRDRNVRFRTVERLFREAGWY